jgi:hypothetical protein
MTTETLAPPTAPAVFTAEQAGIVPGWDEPGRFEYSPYTGHVLHVARRHITAEVLAAFVAPQPVELCFDATGLLVFGLCWRFISVMPETWEGSSYNYARDLGHWPIFECRDPRLMPELARTIRLELCDESGAVAAERRVVMPPLFSHLLNRQVEASATAHDWRDWYKRGCETLLHTYPTPGDIARAVQLQPGGWALPNPKRERHCLAIDLEATP